MNILVFFLPHWRLSSQIHGKADSSESDNDAAGGGDDFHAMYFGLFSSGATTTIRFCVVAACCKGVNTCVPNTRASLNFYKNMFSIKEQFSLKALNFEFSLSAFMYNINT